MDESLLRAELERLHRQSYGWALSCCRRDHARAEDVLQRAYLKVLQGKARYAGIGVFKTWLFAVIRTTAQDENRRELFRRLWLVRYLDRVNATPSPDEADAASADEFEDEFDNGVRRARFVAIFDALPSRQRQVLQLVFYHDMSLSEAAGVMGVSIGSARTHYDRAKKAVRRRLEEKSTDGCGPGPRAVPGIVL
jgi:RNA polymerase sigma-70 factor (ECF subfamily)